MNSQIIKVALLLFGSGMCALVYQTAWLREFRLIFGASTAASAAVLGIFMGGLGLGGLLIGKRVDQNAQPLRLYGHLELLIALSTALTPFLVWVIRQVLDRGVVDGRVCPGSVGREPHAARHPHGTQQRSPIGQRPGPDPELAGTHVDHRRVGRGDPPDGHPHRGQQEVTVVVPDMNGVRTEVGEGVEDGSILGR